MTVLARVGQVAGGVELGCLVYRLVTGITISGRVVVPRSMAGNTGLAGMSAGKRKCRRGVIECRR